MPVMTGCTARRWLRSAMPLWRMISVAAQVADAVEGAWFLGWKLPNPPSWFWQGRRPSRMRAADWLSSPVSGDRESDGGGHAGRRQESGESSRAHGIMACRKKTKMTGVGTAGPRGSSAQEKGGCGGTNGESQEDFPRKEGVRSGWTARRAGVCRCRAGGGGRCVVQGRKSFLSTGRSSRLYGPGRRCR